MNIPQRLRDHCIIKHRFKWQKLTTSFTHALIYSYSSTIHQFISGEWSQRKRLELSICLMRFVWRGWGREKDRHPHTVWTGRNTVPGTKRPSVCHCREFVWLPVKWRKWVDTLSKHHLFFYLKPNLKVYFGIIYNYSQNFN